MSEIDELCGIILAAGAACVFFVFGLWFESEVAGVAAVAVYASALCWIFTRVNKKKI